MKRKSVVVTGGSKRLGKAIADLLDKAGWRVLRTSHRPDSGADIICDLSAEGGAYRLFAEATRLLGAPPDAVVNNAAVYLADAETTRRVNLLAPARLTELMAAGPAGGCVVNILDAAALGGREETRPAFRDYAASKRALLDETLRAAAAFAGRIRVNAIAPGALLGLAPEGVHEKAAAAPFGRPTPQLVAEAAAWLLSAEATTGAVIPVDGGPARPSTP